MRPKVSSVKSTVPGIERLGHDPDREALLGSGLRDVEARAVVQHQPGSERALAEPSSGRRSRQSPAQPSRAGEVHDQVLVAHLDVEELAVATHARDRLTGQGRGGRIEGLEHGERDDVDPVDDASDQARSQVGDERLHFG